jgi:hypothetical protein
MRLLDVTAVTATSYVCVMCNGCGRLPKPTALSQCKHFRLVSHQLYYPHYFSISHASDVDLIFDFDPSDTLHMRHFYNYNHAHARHLHLQKPSYLELRRTTTDFFLTTSGFRWRFHFCNKPPRGDFMLQAKELKTYCNGYGILCNGHPPTDTRHKCPFPFGVRL